MQITNPPNKNLPILPENPGQKHLTTSANMNPFTPSFEKSSTTHTTIATTQSDRHEAQL